MFICAHCGRQSHPYEKPTLVPTVLRRVEYMDDGAISHGTEWVSAELRCTEFHPSTPVTLPDVKVVLIERPTKPRREIQGTT
jgi:hypothetical protein